MQPRDITTFSMRGRNLRYDLIERHWRGVDDSRAGGAMREHLLWHQRAGIKTDRTGRDEIAPAQGQEIGRAGSGADEMHGHSPSPLFTALHCPTGRTACQDR